MTDEIIEVDRGRQEVRITDANGNTISISPMFMEACLHILKIEAD